MSISELRGEKTTIMFERIALDASPSRERLVSQVVKSCLMHYQFRGVLESIRGCGKVSISRVASNHRWRSRAKAIETKLVPSYSHGAIQQEHIEKVSGFLPAVDAQQVARYLRILFLHTLLPSFCTFLRSP